MFICSCFTVEMSCVSPSSSVSQQVSGAGVGVVLPMPVLDERVLQGCTFAQRKEMMVALFAEYYKACSALAVSASGVGSSVESSVTSHSGGASALIEGSSVSSGSRTGSRQRRRWKKRAVGCLGLDPPGHVQPEFGCADPGYCYLQIVHTAWRSDVAKKLGPWPDLGDLMALPLDQLQSVAVISSLMCDLAAGSIHIVDSLHGYTVKQVIAQVALTFRTGIGTLGTAWEPGDTGLRVERSAKVGGKLADRYASLPECLGSLAGSPAHVFSGADVAILVQSAALLGDADKKRLRMFEAAGDNALSMAIATRCLDERASAQMYQDARSLITNNRYLAELFVGKGLHRFVTYVSGVSPLSKPGADSFEAFVGLIYHELGMSAVVRFCLSVNYFDGYMFFDK